MQLIAILFTCLVSAISARRVESTYLSESPKADPKLELLKTVLFAASPTLAGRRSGNNVGRMPSTRMQSTALADIQSKLKEGMEAEDIVKTLETISMLEAAEIVKEIEETFGVDASAPDASSMMMAAPAGPSGGDEEVVAEKTTFDLILESVEGKKIPVLKVVRELTGMGLQEAKAFVEAPPKTVLEGKPKAEIEEAMKKIQDAGGKASMK